MADDTQRIYKVASEAIIMQVRRIAELEHLRDQQTAIIQKQTRKISELEAELSLLNRQCAWRPIEEMHEDHGPCAVINLLEDGTFMEVRWLLELEFNPDEWTHFVEIPKLSTEDAERLIEEYRQAHDLGPQCLCPLPAPQLCPKHGLNLD